MDTTIEIRHSQRRWLDAEALRDIAPILVGLVPFAMILGVTMSDAGVHAGVGVFGSFALYAGSAQLAALALMQSGAGLGMILLSVVIVNARMLLYGASLEPRFRNQPRWFKWLGPHFLVDQSYVVASERAELREPARFRRYWLTVACAITTVWLTTIGATMALGPLLPNNLPLSFAPIAIFVSLLLPKLLNDSRARQVALLAAVGTGAASIVTPGAALIVGISAGIGSELIKKGSN
jgi:4-azaleucine resistance transporter AzlC